jgi:hypothetical protein
VLGAVFGLVALVVAGCTSHAGAAAQVDNQTISTATLSGIVDRGIAAYTAFETANPDYIAYLQANSQTPLTRDTIQRKWLGILVRERLDEVEAGKLGVTVSDEDVSAFYQAYAVYSGGDIGNFDHEVLPLNGFTPQDARLFMRMLALESTLEDKVAPDLVDTDSNARTVYDALVKQYGTLPLSYAQMRPLLERDGAKPESSGSSIYNQRWAKLQPLLTQAAKQVGVSVSPRFGVWSVDDMAVLAQSGSIATVPTPVAQLNLSS